MKVSRVRFWFCKPCNGVYKKERLESRIQLYEGSGHTRVFGTLECARCHAVYQQADIYSGTHDLPRENWREFQNATGESMELPDRHDTGGDSSNEVINATLKEDLSDLTETNTKISPQADGLVRRRLEKKPEAPFHSPHDPGLDIEVLSGSTGGALAMPARGDRRWSRPLAIGALTVGALVVGLGLGRKFTRPAALSDLSFEALTREPQSVFNARFAPYGEAIVYSASIEGRPPAIFVLRPGSSTPRQIGPSGTHLLSVSSTGELAVLLDAAFVAQSLFKGSLARMSMMDGPARPWLENVREADWAPDGSTLAIVRDGVADTVEYPPGTTLYSAPTGAYLSDPRVSPAGDRVAFMEHPTRFDRRGFVKIVDRSRAVRIVAGEYKAEEGLAWTHDGGAVVFGAQHMPSGDYQILTAPAAGDSPPRPLILTPGAALLKDVAADGRLLIDQIRDRTSVRALLDGWTEEREGPGETRNPVLSADGRQLIFTDETVGGNYAVFLWDSNEGAPVRLGEGKVMDLSPDGRWALAEIINGADVHIYPTAAGEARTLSRGPITHLANAGFIGSGDRVFVCGSNATQRLQCSEHDLARGTSTPMGPPGISIQSISPNGRLAFAEAEDGSPLLVSLPEGATVTTASLTSNMRFSGWTPEPGAVFVQFYGRVPQKVERLEIATGRRTLVRELSPPGRAGLLTVGGARITAAGRAYSYNYLKRLSTLFVVKGPSV